MKRAYHEDLEATLQLTAAYQRFAITFTPHAAETPLIDPEEAWLLRGIEPDPGFVVPPLSPDMLASAGRYRAPINPAFRC